MRCATGFWEFIDCEQLVALQSHGAAIVCPAGLDMTRRDLRLVARGQGRPLDLGKDFEQSAVCTEIIPIGALGVLGTGSINLQVNGQTKQHADLIQLIWNIPELLAALPQFYHLQPGDLIYTGSPEGVGAVQSGDVITCHIDHPPIPQHQPTP